MTPDAYSPHPPHGIYAATLDSRGRLHLPAVVEGFPRSRSPEGHLFVTTLDQKTGQIYPPQTWAAAARGLGESTAHRKAARDLLFCAHHLGERLYRSDRTFASAERSARRTRHIAATGPSGVQRIR